MENGLLKAILSTFKIGMNSEIDCSLVPVITHLASAPSLVETMKRDEIISYLELISNSACYEETQVSSG